MAKVLNVAGGGYSRTTNGTHYIACANVDMSGHTAEASRRITYRTAGTLSNLWINAYVNTSNGTNVIRVRKNGANGNQVITVAVGVTGTFEDTSNTDSISAGDSADYSWTFNGNTGTFSVAYVNTLFEASSNTVIRHAASGGLSISTQTINYAPLAGFLTAHTTEASVKNKLNSAGTLKNLYVYVLANTRTSNTSVAVRKNGNTTICLVTIGAGATGIFEDTSNTVSVSANDNLNYITVTGVGGGTIAIDIISTEFETTNDKFHAQCWNLNTQNANVTAYWLLGGRTNTLDPEGRVQAELNILGTASNLYIYVTANGVTATSTFTLRKSGADTALTISIGSGVSGAFEDTSNTVGLGSADLANYSLVTGASGTSMGVSVMGVMVKTIFEVERQEVISIVESVSLKGIFRKSFLESLALSEIMSAIGDFQISDEDRLILNEIISVLASSEISVSDVIKLNEILSIQEIEAPTRAEEIEGGMYFPFGILKIWNKGQWDAIPLKMFRNNSWQERIFTIYDGQNWQKMKTRKFEQ